MVCHSQEKAIRIKLTIPVEIREKKEHTEQKVCPAHQVKEVDR